MFSVRLADFGSSVTGITPLDSESAIGLHEAFTGEDIMSLKRYSGLPSLYTHYAEKTTTLPYRAPELVDLHFASRLPREERCVGPAVDVWALGCTLFHLAFNTTPFEDSTGTVQRMAILNGNAVFPRMTPYSAGLVSLIRACLTVDPSSRPTVFDLLRMGAELPQWPSDEAPVDSRPSHAATATGKPPLAVAGRQLYSDQRTALARERLSADAYATLSSGAAPEALVFGPASSGRATGGRVRTGAALVSSSNTREHMRARGGLNGSAGPPRPSLHTDELGSEDDSDTEDGSLHASGAHAGGEGGTARALNAATGALGAAASFVSSTAAGVAVGVSAIGSSLGGAAMRSVPRALAETLQTRLMQLMGPSQRRYRWLIKATSLTPGPPKQKYVRRLILDAWESGGGGAVIDFLPRRPLEDSSVIAAKACALLLKLWQRGPPAAFPASLILSELLSRVTVAYATVPAPAVDGGRSAAADPNFESFVSRFASHLVQKLEITEVDAHYVRVAQGGDAEASIDETLRLAGSIVTLLESGVSVAHAAFDVGILEQEALSVLPTRAAPGSGAMGAEAGSPPAAGVACAVGCLPPLVVETWAAYASSTAILIKVIGRLRIAKTRNQDLERSASRLCTRVDAASSHLRLLHSRVRRLHAHPTLRLYVDALDALPDIGTESPFSVVLAGEAPAAGTDRQVRSQTASLPVQQLLDDRGAVKDVTAGLRDLLRVPGNDRCCECSQVVGGAAWASINLGLILCLRCSGVHQGLGVHVSQVRSATLDTWRPEWIRTCRAIGNVRGALYWEAAPGARVAKPSTSSSAADVARWCDDKYVRRLYVAQGPPPHESLQLAIHQQRTSLDSSESIVGDAAQSMSFSPFRAAVSDSSAPAASTSVARGSVGTDGFEDFGAALPFDSPPPNSSTAAPIPSFAVAAGSGEWPDDNGVAGTAGDDGWRADPGAGGVVDGTTGSTPRRRMSLHREDSWGLSPWFSAPRGSAPGFDASDRSADPFQAPEEYW